MGYLFCFSQSPQKTTYLQIVTNLAQTCRLELSFSSDLVNLNDSTDFVFSTDPDSCLIQVQMLAGLKITKTANHLIILPEAPELIHLQGLVIDSQTKEPLPYAHLIIKTSGIGTITNKDGLFDFKIQGHYAQNEITFSFLGYSNKSYKIPFTDTDSLVIEMVAKPYTLSDIYVLPNGTEAVDIVKRAVKNIKRNYHRNAVQMDAFYRSTSFRDTTPSQLIEAALLIEDKGINKPIQTTSIKLQQVRKSSNYLIPQNKKWELLEKAWGHRNMFFRALGRNIVRYYREDWWYKPLTDYKTFKYEFEGFEWLDSVKVYKIKFIYDHLWPNGQRASENKNAENAGYIFINADDWGILKVEQWCKLYGNFANKYAFKDGYISKNEIVYQKLNGKYYLKFTSGFTLPDGELFIFENPDAPDREKIIKERQWAEDVLLVTNIITERKKFDKIKYREKLARDENSYKKIYPYNSAFWKNYNILKENPVEEKLINSLEWEKPLDQQFQENSSNDAGN